MNPADRQRKKRVLQRRIRRNGNHDSHAGAKLKLMEDEERKEQGLDFAFKRKGE